MIIRELCLENFTTIPQALQAGVERIELCDNLAVGGTTPSYGVIEEAANMFPKVRQLLLSLFVLPVVSLFIIFNYFTFINLRCGMFEYAVLALLKAYLFSLVLTLIYIITNVLII